ncbi:MULTISPECIES: hypothetical protein [Brevibacillus]|uniref:Uncharacterized protein n=1 Tax=Brevibacillus brevis (strain 47 / JCM 6285 / NBRC 100599) TaxID=358681 RepID=C0ZFL7_BREBN|nr:hypothetical protein [Brevibacillus brevis]BAH44576.1 hypothetical protein BBR47_35990 [Brevibacillus brevis NBRC 100599]
MFFVYVLVYLIVAFLYGFWTMKSQQLWVRLTGNFIVHLFIATIVSLGYFFT